MVSQQLGTTPGGSAGAAEPGEAAECPLNAAGQHGASPPPGSVWQHALLTTCAGRGYPPSSTQQQGGMLSPPGAAAQLQMTGGHSAEETSRKGIGSQELCDVVLLPCLHTAGKAKIFLASSKSSSQVASLCV